MLHILFFLFRYCAVLHLWEQYSFLDFFTNYIALIFEINKNSYNLLLFSLICGSMLDDKKKYITILIKLIRYTIGLFFLFAFMMDLFNGKILSALFAFAIGIILIPETSIFIENKLNIKPSAPVKLIIILCLLFGLGLVNPVDQTDYTGMTPIGDGSQQVNNSSTLAVEAETQKVNESSQEPIAAPTQEVQKSNPEPVSTPIPTPTPTPTPTSSPGKLDILTNPSGASVTIDGVSKGKSPIEGLEIEPGTHTVTVYLSGYNPQQEKVEIGNSETKTLPYTLVPETKPSQASTPSQEKKERNAEPVATETEPTAKYQDADWAAVMSRNAFIIADDASKIGDASADSDFVSVSAYGSALYFDSLKAIEDSNKYEVSPALQPTKDEFEDALHYAREGGSNIVSGIDEINQGRTDEGTKYINAAVSDLNKCTEHTNTANKMLEEYQAKLE